jgi:triosephosphate isomerase
MRRLLIAANWKMHGSTAMINDFAENFDQNVDFEADVVLFPPTVYLSALTALTSEFVQTGSQDIAVHSQGPHTGDVAGAMVHNVGGRWVIVGHSERRTDHGESDELVAQKFAAAIAAGLSPIACVGESLEQRDLGQANEVVNRQVKAIIDRCGIHGLKEGVIAYEPLWAIGSGVTATPAEAAQMHRAIRDQVGAADGSVAASLRLIYGGSVTPENAAMLFAQEEIDGALVGGASLDALSFAAIVAAR